MDNLKPEDLLSSYSNWRGGFDDALPEKSTIAESRLFRHPSHRAAHSHKFRRKTKCPSPSPSNPPQPAGTAITPELERLLREYFTMMRALSGGCPVHLWERYTKICAILTLEEHELPEKDQQVLERIRKRLPTAG